MDEKEKLFLELINDFQWRYDIDRYPHSIFAFKEDKFIFEIYNSEPLNQRKIIASYRLGIKQDLKNARIWFNYDRIWSIFKSNFEMKDNDIEFFMRNMLEKHFKMSGVTPHFGRNPTGLVGKAL
jgi:hypothetical protein